MRGTMTAAYGYGYGNFDGIDHRGQPARYNIGYGVTYSLNGGVPIDICTDCGADPAILLSGAMAPGTNELTVMILSEGTEQPRWHVIG